jgi:hypothetical protein
MKIGILTLPFHTNLGGILQNYALQKTLRRMGHSPSTINFKQKEIKKITILFSVLKRIVMRVVFRKRDVTVRVWPTANEKKLIYGGINEFIDNNILLTQPIFQVDDLYKKEKFNFDAYIVGSDQVWRPRYVKKISTFFFDFVHDDSKVIKLAYAASFGEDSWEYTLEETEQCRTLALKFDAISVREESAVSLVKQYFGVEAIEVLDPVFLLTQKDYEALTLDNNNQQFQGGIFSYILDKTVERLNFIDKISKTIGLDTFSILPMNRFEDVGSNGVESCIHPSISDWINSYVNAEFIITDSFHGVVLSIIFKKEFICIGNKNRGLTRMTNILKKYNLMDRLIFDNDTPSDLMKLEKINYLQIHTLLEIERKKSLAFLKSFLEKGNFPSENIL